MRDPIALWRRRAQALAILVIVAGVLRAGLGLVPRTSLATRLPQSQAAFDSDGKLLAMTRAGDDRLRLWVGLDRMSPQLVEATLLYEDRWFEWHWGVNPASLVRAGYASIVGRQWIGASTVTMQLARRLAGLHTRSALGKLQQIGYALWLDARYSKREILEAYFNSAPYGGDLEGVFAASQAWFGKAPDELDLGEALALAVIPQNPNRRGRAGATQGELDRARGELWQRWRRRHLVDEIEDLAMAEPIALRRHALPLLAPHFSRQVLVEQPSRTTIKTTLDRKLQLLVEARLAAYFRQRHREGLHNAAVLVVDHRTAEIKALVGSADFFDKTLHGEVDGTRAFRSPGSLLKPFVYARALEAGVITPESLVFDVPRRYADYAPENFDGRFAGPIPATQALVTSRNIPAVELNQQLGSDGLHALLRRSKINRLGPESRHGAGLALGAVEMTLQELVALYAALAHGGELRKLRATASEGGAPRTVAGTSILSPEASFLVLDMLSHNPRPLRTAQPSTARDQIAWKTGTSWGFRDAWTVGVAGPYVIGVWVGDFRGKGDASFTGLRAAAPIFFDLVEAMLPDGAGRFSPPATLARQEVCSLSGSLPGPHCPHRKQTWFWPGHSPFTLCELHQVISVDDKGRRACKATRGPVHDEVVEQWSSELRTLFAEVGLPRRSLPEPAPECAGTEVAGSAPRITSPVRALLYAPTAEHNRITLAAVLGADASEVFWYSGRRLLGRALAGQPLVVTLEPGRHALLAVDNLGRSDARSVTVTAMP